MTTDHLKGRLSTLADVCRSVISTKTGLAGTPAYMAPEQFEGHRVTEKVDVFAFAVLCWEMFTGTKPWGGVTSPMQVAALNICEAAKTLIPGGADDMTCPSRCAASPGPPMVVHGLLNICEDLCCADHLHGGSPEKAPSTAIAGPMGSQEADREVLAA